MSVIDAMTEGGTIYRFHGGNRWIRVAYHPKRSNSEGIIKGMLTAPLMVGESRTLPSRDPSSWVESPTPVVGKHLYVAGMKDFWVSRKVIKVVEQSSLNDPYLRLRDYYRETNMHVGNVPAPEHFLEDKCPCPQSPCGLIAFNDINEDCPYHSETAGKRVKQAHLPEDCKSEVEHGSSLPLA